MSFWSKLESLFLTVVGKIEVWLKPAAQYLAANGGPVLVAAAEAAVAAVAADPSMLSKSGSEKRDAAGKQITAQLTAQGIPVVVAAINLAIEAALAGTKEVQ